MHKRMRMRILLKKLTYVSVITHVVNIFG